MAERQAATGRPVRDDIGSDDGDGPSEDIRVVRRIYRAIAAGSREVFQHLAPDIRWTTPPELPWTLPGSGGTYVGRRELAGYFANCLGHVDQLRVDVHELVESDGRVLMIGYERGTARTTGRGFAALCAHVWHVRNGRAVRLEGFVDTSAIARAFTRDASGVRPYLRG